MNKVKDFLVGPALRSQTTKGFTLIELIIVVAIITILSTIGIASYLNLQNKARDTKRIADVEAIAKAYETSYNNSTRQYLVLTAVNFTNGLPQPPRLGDYTGFLTEGQPNFTICTKLEETSPETVCVATSHVCYCLSSIR